METSQLLLVGASRHFQQYSIPYAFFMRPPFGTGNMTVGARGTPTFIPTFVEGTGKITIVQYLEETVCWTV